MCSARARPPGCSAMADEIRALSAQLAQDPQSLVFLRLGEALRRKGQLEAAMRVATNGLERHPHLADAHDLYARILTDKHDYERAFDEWDMAVRIAPHHTGALKGLAFLYFKVGDLAQAEAHLEQARKVEPDDPSIDQAIEMMHKGLGPPSPTPSPAPKVLADTDCLPRAGSDLQGRWEGLLGNGPEAVRVVVRISEPSSNNFHAELDNLSGPWFGQPLLVTCEQRNVQLLVASRAGMFQGRLNDDASQMLGNWVQGGRKSPAKFWRAD